MRYTVFDLLLELRGSLTDKSELNDFNISLTPYVLLPNPSETSFEFCSTAIPENAIFRLLHQSKKSKKRKV
jgi:hypothetical protein